MRTLAIGVRLKCPVTCIAVGAKDFDRYTRTFTLSEEPKLRGDRWTAHGLWLDCCYFADDGEPVGITPFVKRIMCEPGGHVPGRDHDTCADCGFSGEEIRATQGAGAMLRRYSYKAIVLQGEHGPVKVLSGPVNPLDKLSTLERLALAFDEKGELGKAIVHVSEVAWAFFACDEPVLRFVDNVSDAYLEDEKGEHVDQWRIRRAMLLVWARDELGKRTEWLERARLALAKLGWSPSGATPARARDVDSGLPIADAGAAGGVPSSRGVDGAEGVRREALGGGVSASRPASPTPFEHVPFLERLSKGPRPREVNHGAAGERPELALEGDGERAKNTGLTTSSDRAVAGGPSFEAQAGRPPAPLSCQCEPCGRAAGGRKCSRPPSFLVLRGGRRMFVCSNCDSMRDVRIVDFYTLPETPAGRLEELKHRYERGDISGEEFLALIDAPMGW